jgi:single-strand DNA-binding protein
MSSVNKVILIGRVGQDPELKYTANGHAAVNLSVATSETWKDKATNEKKEETEWHRVSIFGKPAEVAGQYIRKGSMVYIEGRIKSKKYTDKQGIERTAFEIICSQFQMIGKAPEGNAPKQELKPIDDFQDNDIPF